METDPIQPVKAWCYAQLADVYQMSGKREDSDKSLAEAQKLDQAYLKEDRLPPMMLYDPPGKLSFEYHSYFDTY